MLIGHTGHTGQTVTDAPFLANPAETCEITLKCDPAPYYYRIVRLNTLYFGRDARHIVLGADEGKRMRCSYKDGAETEVWQ